MGSLTSHSYLRVVKRDLQLIVLIREDLKVYPFADDEITKAAVSSTLFKDPESLFVQSGFKPTTFRSLVILGDPVTVGRVDKMSDILIP